MSNRVRVSAAEARRIALAAQGFDRERPKQANDVRHFRRALAAIAVLQLDFVNVLIPAHFLMIWSRLGPYDRPKFERYLYHSGEYIEQWAHEASVVASSDWPLLAHRRDAFKAWKSSPLKQLPDRDAYLQNILSLVESQGETSSHDLPPLAGPKKKAGDWHRSVPRWAIEHHFGTGKLAVRRRRRNFQRVYDLPQRVLPEKHRTASFEKEDAERALLLTASRAIGIGTVHDIADYYRMSNRDVVPRLNELLEEGALTQVDVEGWKDIAYLSSDAVSPRAISGACLLSPFDPVVWFRPRALRLFGFDYRIEIYVPQAKRRWGYYVLPFRHGDRITARIDLKADRKASVLTVQYAHLENGANAAKTAEALGAELNALCEWLTLDRIKVRKSNDFEKQLASSI